MPLVVSRWHLVWSKKPLSARNLKEFAVSGAFAASSAIGMVPQVVWSVKVYFAVLSIVIAGAVFHCAVPTLPAAGLAHGSATFALALALALADGVAAAFAASSDFLLSLLKA